MIMSDKVSGTVFTEEIFAQIKKSMDANERMMDRMIALREMELLQFSSMGRNGNEQLDFFEDDSIEDDDIEDDGIEDDGIEVPSIKAPIGTLAKRGRRLNRYGEEVHMDKDDMPEAEDQYLEMLRCVDELLSFKVPLCGIHNIINDSRMKEESQWLYKKSKIKIVSPIKYSTFKQAVANGARLDNGFCYDEEYGWKRYMCLNNYERVSITLKKAICFLDLIYRKTA